MKIYLTLFLGFFLVFNKAHAIKESKIIKVGYVNYTKLMEKSNNQIFEKAQKLKESYEEQIQSLTTEVEDLKITVGSNSSASNINNNVLLLEEKTLDLSLLKIRASEELSKIGAEVAKMNEVINTAIQNIAKKQDFNIILDSSVILIGSPYLDITNLVLASL